jgi:hypothetical protein
MENRHLRWLGLRCGVWRNMLKKQSKRKRRKETKNTRERGSGAKSKNIQQ